jgi:predicted Zn-dependent protease
MPLLQELLKGQADRDAGRLDAAASRLEGPRAEGPENPAVFVALTSVYFRRNDTGSALKSAKRAVALDPESAVAVLDLALAFQAAGHPDEAATGFDACWRSTRAI